MPYRLLTWLACCALAVCTACSTRAVPADGGAPNTTARADVPGISLDLGRTSDSVWTSKPCWTNAQCDTRSYCKRPSCSARGQCWWRPANPVCNDDGPPVCGCDGTTYSCEDEAAARGTDIDTSAASCNSDCNNMLSKYSAALELARKCCYGCDGPRQCQTPVKTLPCGYTATIEDRSLEQTLNDLYNRYRTTCPPAPCPPELSKPTRTCGSDNRCR